MQVEIRVPKRPPLPQVEPPTEEQMDVLEYRALLDTSLFQGASRRAARETAHEADQATLLREAIADLPRPATFPDLAETQVNFFPMTDEVLPRYEPLLPQANQRMPVDASIDPIERPVLYMLDFKEKVSPAFEDAAFPRPRPPKPACVEEERLSATMSIFDENNEDFEDRRHAWGLVPKRKSPCAPFVEDMLLPPPMVLGTGARGRLVLRTLWDPEMHTSVGRMIPPLYDYGQALYTPQRIVHPDEDRWTRILSPLRSGGSKVKESINLVPVKQFRKYSPQRVSVSFPDFLYSLAREESSGQTVWSVLDQRKSVPIEILNEREEERQRKARFDEVTQNYGADEHEEADPDSPVVPEGEATLQGPVAAIEDASGEAAPGEAAPLAPPEPSRAYVGQLEVARETIATEDAAGAVVLPSQREDLPEMEVSLPPAPPPLAAGLAPLEALATQGLSSAAPVAGVPPPPQPPETHSQPAAVQRQSSQLQEKLLQALNDQSGRKVDEVLSDDKFIDKLAERITVRLGGAEPTRMPPGMGGRASPFGGTRGSIVHPDIPSFAEPEDHRSVAVLPRALGHESNNAAAKLREAAATNITTVQDVNAFTQEKMRGEAYVRILIKPEASMAQVGAVPYGGDMLPPDTSLVTGAGRPNLVMPKQAPELDEDGNIIEDDEFANFERNDTVAFSFVRHNRFDAVEALIQQNPDILKSRDPAGNTLLHVACQNDNRRVAKLLVKNGLSVDVQNNGGNTPLHFCAHYGFMALGDFLVQMGADESLTNKQGMLPAQGLGKEDPNSTQQGFR